VALQNSYFEFKIDQEKAMEGVIEEYEKIVEDFEKISGRKYEIFEKYATEDAQKIMILTGSAMGTAKEAVDKLHSQGEKVGLLKINLFRPFPFEEIASVLKDAREIIVLDRAQSIGSNPPFYGEVINSLYTKSYQLKTKSYIYGLGGRDLFQQQIIDVFLGKIEDKYLT
jgi:pyruvate ferredoxin oxidoreductase alpha subunit